MATLESLEVSIEAVDRRVDGLAEQMGNHGNRCDTDRDGIRKDVESLKLWRAELRGQLAGWAAAGALGGGLLSQFPALLRYLAGHP